MEKEYKTTKEECWDRIKGVCDGCGGELVPMETVDNSDSPTYWAGCEHCSKFCWGVDKKVWEIARKLVLERNWRPYSSMSEGDYKTEAEKEYWLDSQTAGAVRQVYDVINIGKLELP